MSAFSFVQCVRLSEWTKLIKEINNLIVTVKVEAVDDVYLRLTWCRLTCVYLEEELFTWLYLDSPGFTWAHLGLPGGRAIKQVYSGYVLLFDEQVNKFMIFVLLQSCLKGSNYDVAYYVYCF